MSTPCRYCGSSPCDVCIEQEQQQRECEQDCAAHPRKPIDEGMAELRQLVGNDWEGVDPEAWVEAQRGEGGRA